VLVTRAPPVGEYKWELGGVRAVGISFRAVTGSEERLVRRASAIPNVATDKADSTDFTFQVVEPYQVPGSVLELTYQVRSDNQGQGYQSAPAGNSSAYAASPDAGLSLVSEDVVDHQGGITPLFHPAAPLLLVPLPVQPGGTFSSLASDPTTGAVTYLKGTVVRRARVDACGAIIEGWEVAGLEQTNQTTGSVSPPSGRGTSGANVNFPQQNASVDTIYATQFGVMPIAEHDLVVDPLLGTSSVDDAIGQEQPKALPAGTS
jgi:hypothetical protein